MASPCMNIEVSEGKQAPSYFQNLLLIYLEGDKMARITGENTLKDDDDDDDDDDD
jgi:hypothetical protein